MVYLKPSKPLKSLSPLKSDLLKNQSMDDPHLKVRKAHIALIIAKNLNFALRSIDLNNHRKPLQTNIVEEHNSLRSMIVTFQVAGLAILLENKHRFAKLAKGFEKVKQVGKFRALFKRHQVDLSSKLILTHIFNDFYFKYQHNFLRKLSEVKHLKHVIFSRIAAKRSLFFSMLISFANSKTINAVAKLRKNSHLIGLRLRNLFFKLLLINDFKVKSCLFFLMRNQNCSAISRANIKIKSSLMFRLVHANKLKLGAAMISLYLPDINENNDIQKMHRRRVENKTQAPAIVIEELSEDTREAEKDKFNIMRFNLINKLIFSQNVKLRLVIRTISLSPFTKPDLKFVQRWFFNTLAINNRIKVLDACQILRFPTIKRHQKQKASIKLEKVLFSNLHKYQQIGLNTIFKNSDNFHLRYRSLINWLFKKTARNLGIGYFGILSNKGIDPQKLITVRFLGIFLESKQIRYDTDFKRPCFVKLGSLLDLETSSGKRYNKQNYKFDILMKKRLQLEENVHPLILKKINIVCKNESLLKKIEKCKARNMIYQEKINNLNEETRFLELKKQTEIKALVSRKVLGFSFENELKKMIGDVFGPPKQTKNENNSLSHAVDHLETSVKVVDLDKSGSKNGEWEESNWPSAMENVRAKTFNDLTLIENAKSNTNFKVNNSDKVLLDMESKKILKKLNCMNLENLSEKDIARFDQTISKLLTSKSELENLLEKLTADLSDFLNNAVFELKKNENLKNRVSINKQNFVKYEMILIDMQEKKGMLQFEKTELVQVNETTRIEIDSINKAISDIKNLQNCDSSKMAELERLKLKYFQKVEATQNNSQKILKLDQEILEISRKIVAYQEKNNEIRLIGRTFEDQQKTHDSEIKESNEHANEIREEIQNIIKQISWHGSLIESLEMKKRNISYEESLLSQRSMLDLDGYNKFKDRYLRLDGLTIKKTKLILQKNEFKKEQKIIFEEQESLIEALEKTAASIDKSPENEDKINKLNQKWKKANLQNEILVQKINKLDSEKHELIRQIKSEKSKIIEVMNDQDDFDRRTAETGSVNDTKGDIRKQSMFMITRMNFDPMEQIENATIRYNLLNYSKSNINDENFKPILASRLNTEYRETVNLAENNLISNQSFDEILHALIQKKGDYLQNKQLSFFNLLKKEEFDDRIKGNSCLILEYKQQILDNEIEIKSYRLVLRENRTKIAKLKQLIRNHLPEQRLARDQGLFNRTETISTQTLVEDIHYYFNFEVDKADTLSLKQKGYSPEGLNLIDATIIPRKPTLAIQDLEPILSKKIRSMKLSKNLLEFDHQDFFDGKNQKILDDGGLELEINNSNLQNSIILEEYFPIDQSSRKHVKKMAVRNQSVQLISFLNVPSYQQLHNTNRVNKRVAPIDKPMPIKKLREIGEIIPIIDNKNDCIPTKLRAAYILCKVIPRVVKNYANLSFYHFKLITSNAKLRSLMNALAKFKLNNLAKNYNKIQSELSNKFAVSVFEALQKVSDRRQRYGFQKIKKIFDAKRKTRNVLLTKWMARGDNTMKKHIKLTLQYWKHIKNDNLWNVNILKQMVLKSPLIPQIALWRLMLFKKRDYSCPPETVKGLLSIMASVDIKQLNKGFKAIISWYSGARLTNDFKVELIPGRKGLVKSEFLKDVPNFELEMKSQELFSILSYCVILQKQAKFKFFYKLLKQVKDNTTNSRIPNQEVKDGVAESEADPGMNMVKFLLDQQIRCKLEINEKNAIIEDLHGELNEKNQNLIFMKYYLLNFSLLRLERISKRIFNKNQEQAKAIFILSLMDK